MMMGISIKEENASRFFVSFSVFIIIISIIIIIITSSITITRNGLFSLSLSLYASITLLLSSLPKRLRLRRLKFVKWKTRTRRPRRGITPPRTRF